MRYTLQELGQVTDTKTGRKIPPNPIPLATARITQKALNNSDLETKPENELSYGEKIALENLKYRRERRERLAKEEEERQARYEEEVKPGKEQLAKARAEFQKLLVLIKEGKSKKSVINKYYKKVDVLLSDLHKYFGYGTHVDLQNDFLQEIEEAYEKKKRNK